MCGIVGISARRDVVAHLISGLKALEYRGYDSAGVAVLADGRIERLRTQGKVQALEALHAGSGVAGHCGIAHTRWATHGVPSEGNAHPHVSGPVSVVHNGIIENHAALRAELQAAGYVFTSQTDSEVIAHLVARALDGQPDLLAAVRSVLPRLHGAYSIAVMSTDEPGVLVGARLGSPLVAGLGSDENYLASDIHALLPLTRRFIYLAEGDVARVDAEGVAIWDEGGAPVERAVRESQFSTDAVERGEYRHYMLKEIHEQPQALADTLEGRIAGGRVLTQILGVDAEDLLARTEAVHIVACGTSYHAGLVARYWIESLAGIPCTAEIASEYRYRNPVVRPGTLFVSISQSGETADTLAALKLARERGYLAQLAVCNVPESSIVRESSLVLMTRAGPEIGVASTKAFTTQLAALALFALAFARAKGLDEQRYLDGVRQLEQLPGLVAETLRLDAGIQDLAGDFADKQHALFLGRGTHWPVAMEGALKLKEISYIHAEAYAAGELKHGPLALVDAQMPVIAVAPNDTLIDKLLSNLEEVRTRGGVLYVFADHDIGSRVDDSRTLVMPACGEIAAPIVSTVPLQLLSYHVAVLRGTDVDQPRNLAKSVTVE
ncbi:glutamine--fructose-6-phosphate transaminase (isomerizing) [Coralloluteibacterium stylophorae]|uniref:Glutamine--fructose-6-phosphate aminotransferase [isomerizing] n=1 Tax=Coralloluteibacterium stylophorae TaxID=1776034 RepID=A0A8J8AYZ6_9GAMM|nr:glutamine--fructose-6-phosphate transaminase (isomerizing) [Coralloluteibacterium stylophorae]MBS7457977.1 glutamine--fructose-6-phosphate transaminase (isomerizing) [Coralloluteibacterium stylophorae]